MSPKRTKWSPIHVFGGCLALLVLGWTAAAMSVGLISIVYDELTGAGIRDSSAYAQAEALIEQSPGVRAAIGHPIEGGRVIDGDAWEPRRERGRLGRSRRVWRPGEASFSISLSGPKGAGNMLVQGKTDHWDRWIFSTLKFEADAGDTIDVLAEWQAALSRRAAGVQELLEQKADELSQGGPTD